MTPKYPVNRADRRAVAAACLLPLVLIPAAFFGAGRAAGTPAQDNVYLSALADAGIGYSDRNAVITLGWAVCADRAAGRSEHDIVIDISENTGLAEPFALVLVMAAENAYCNAMSPAPTPSGVVIA